jgi:hemerythrin-like domain-containing protein
MNPTEILKDEHRVIERVLDCLEVMASEAEEHGRLDGASAKEALDFIRNFADGCHHHKEEELLFPMLEANGLPRVGGPTGVMLYEHDEGRKLVRSMASVVDSASAGDSAAVESFANAARDFVKLLRAHIEKEDHCLFPIVGQVLNADNQRVLQESFDEAAHSEACEQSHQHYLELADTLCQKFGALSG